MVTRYFSSQAIISDRSGAVLFQLAFFFKNLMASGKPSRFSTRDFVKLNSFLLASSFRLTVVSSSRMMSIVSVVFWTAVVCFSSSAFRLPRAFFFVVRSCSTSASLWSNCASVSDCSEVSDSVFENSPLSVSSWISLISMSFFSVYRRSLFLVKLCLFPSKASCASCALAFCSL